MMDLVPCKMAKLSLNNQHQPCFVYSLSHEVEVTYLCLKQWIRMVGKLSWTKIRGVSWKIELLFAWVEANWDSRVNDGGWVCSAYSIIPNVLLHILQLTRQSCLLNSNTQNQLLIHNPMNGTFGLCFDYFLPYFGYFLSPASLGIVLLLCFHFPQI